jgi:hypothetical protein
VRLLRDGLAVVLRYRAVDLAEHARVPDRQLPPQLLVQLPGAEAPDQDRDDEGRVDLELDALGQPLVAPKLLKVSL